MAGSTAVNGIPYRTGTDAPDIPGATLGIASAVDRRLVPVFATPTERDSKIPAPTMGMLCAVVSLGQLLFHTGSGWVQTDTQNRYTRGTFNGSSGTPTASAVTINHNLGVTPSAVFTQLRFTPAAGAINLIHQTSNATQSQFALYAAATGALVSGAQAIAFDWWAII